MKSTNYLQYKTQGVANIFAPTIFINGVRHISASNADDNNNAIYPSNTISDQQRTMSQQNARQASYDNEFQSLMGNLSSNENLGNELSNNLLREQGEPLGNDNGALYASNRVGSSSGASHSRSDSGSTAGATPNSQSSGEQSSTGSGASSGSSQSSTGSGASSGTGASSFSGIENNNENWYSRRYGNSTNSTPVAANSQETGTSQWFSNTQRETSLTDDERHQRDCRTFCEGQVRDFVTGRMVPRPCTEFCMTCDVCEGRQQYTPQGQESQEMSDVDCYGLSQTQCNLNSNCFYCISQSNSNDYNCRTHPNHSRTGICDKKYSSACVPISGREGNYNLDTEGPLRNMSNYVDTSNYYSVTQGMDGNPPPTYENILDFPANCKAPIDPQLTYDEMRQAMGMRS